MHHRLLRSLVVYWLERLEKAGGRLRSGFFVFGLTSDRLVRTVLTRQCLSSAEDSLLAYRISRVQASKAKHRSILRKEVIQPQVPLRLPCYDLVPITELILGACVLAVHAATWDAPRFRGLTGGVYKAQEHIHRSIADLRLLAIPASCRRIAACNLN